MSGNLHEISVAHKTDAPSPCAVPRRLGWIDINWKSAAVFGLAAVVCFQIAYGPARFGPWRLLVVAYLICLTQLARLPSTRQAFYTGLAIGVLCVAPQLECFWRIFGSAAIPLWVVVAFWTGLFVALVHALEDRLGAGWAAVLTPFVWTGFEYFRSELYFLRFSWLNVGYAFADSPFGGSLHAFGMYGLGFAAAVVAAVFLCLRPVRALTAALLVGAVVLLPALLPTRAAPGQVMHIAGVQLEFPSEHDLPRWLDHALRAHPETDLLVLSEYTLDGPVPDALKQWCQSRQRYLIVGGKQPATNGNFYNTAFVVGPRGDIVFHQVKSVPLQFFKDGLPAPSQTCWDSPWGKLGICICYDLSYARVTDRFVKAGAQAIIVPTMDMAEWGRREHELHALVAPVRAAEYGLPIFRVASSGISQSVRSDGHVSSMAPFPGEGAPLFAEIQLPSHGSLPLDRILAPICVAVTAVTAIAALLAATGNWLPRRKQAA